MLFSCLDAPYTVLSLFGSFAVGGIAIVAIRTLLHCTNNHHIIDKLL